MKEIKIQLRLVDNKIATIIKTSGFEDNTEKVLTMIGIFENLKQTQLEKLKNLSKDLEDGI